MKRIILVLLLSLLFSLSLYAGNYSTVPLDSEIYTILDWAEVKGILPRLNSVKPYNQAQVIGYLEEILHSGRLNGSQKMKIEEILAVFSHEYEATDEISAVVKNGYAAAYNETLGITTALGAGIETEVTSLLSSPEVYDLRSVVRPFLTSDIGSFASVYMDAGIRLDKLDNTPFMDTDFTIPGEGFYILITEGGARLENIPDPEGRIFAGFDFYPELSLSFLDNSLQFKIGNYDRNWGQGSNALQLAGSARPFEAIEGYLELSDWLRYSYITGSLGIFSLTTLGGEDFFSDDLNDRADYRFNTNYSAKRVEVDITEDITFGIFESCVWQKRFELAYLNPFGILMLEQNLYGDLDNMLAGVDFQWRVPEWFNLYGTFATTEMHEIDPARFFTAPRNIMGFQFGADMPLPVGLFSMLKLQYTKLDPFFYTHYTQIGDFLHPIYRTDGTAALETAYVNKGENLGFPLHPNSDELLLQADIGLKHSVTGTFTVRYQRRSGQYGYEIDAPVVAGYAEFNNYDDKDFLNNIFKHTVSLDLGAKKEFEFFPITVFGNLHYWMDRDRVFTDETGANAVLSDVWNVPVHNTALTIGMHLYK